MARSLSVRDIDAGDFQRREWRVERAGWIALVLVLVAAGFGVFGSGPLSSTESVSGDGSIRVDYERFVRHSGQSQLTATVAPDAVRDGYATVRLSAGLNETMDIESVFPEPESSTSDGSGVIFRFAVETGSPLVMRVHYRPQSIGTNSGYLRTGQGDAAHVRQFTYP
ncbi:hypothetical protein G1H11_14670 [Phytoactinopolyspora alkaliphila]|uniref:Uncharacterized protein n=1 Tax=Phytoactinopolyspora alkaliphila TaxID=1783498 RepID=A0A6N9YNA8_9ACTN|nr:hypothetical protein [Phytoactinopolyspora alkaliphila]NED96551.1 hypothetical protein [Phytoactinopolyspora alkaliphila]